MATHTEEAYKDFFSYYSDIITVNSLDIDFSRSQVNSAFNYPDK